MGTSTNGHPFLIFGPPLIEQAEIDEVVVCGFVQTGLRLVHVNA